MKSSCLGSSQPTKTITTNEQLPDTTTTSTENKLQYFTEQSTPLDKLRNVASKLKAYPINSPMANVNINEEVIDPLNECLNTSTSEDDVKNILSILSEIATHLELPPKPTKTIIGYYIKNNQPEQAIEFFNTIQNKNWQLDAGVTYVLMHAYVKAKMMPDLQSLLSNGTPQLPLDSLCLKLFFRKHSFSENANSYNSVEYWINKFVNSTTDDNEKILFLKAIVRVHLTDYNKLERVLNKINELKLLSTVFFNIAISKYWNCGLFEEAHKLIKLAINFKVYHPNLGQDGETLDFHNILTKPSNTESIAAPVAIAILAYVLSNNNKLTRVITGHNRGVAIKNAILEELKAQNISAQVPKDNPGLIILPKQHTSSAELNQGVLYSPATGIASIILNEPSRSKNRYAELPLESDDDIEDITPSNSNDILNGDLQTKISLLSRIIDKTHETADLQQSDEIENHFKSILQMIDKTTSEEWLATSQHMSVLVNLCKILGNAKIAIIVLDTLATKTIKVFDRDCAEMSRCLLHITHACMVYRLSSLADRCFLTIQNQYLNNHQSDNSKLMEVVEGVSDLILYSIRYNRLSIIIKPVERFFNNAIDTVKQSNSFILSLVYYLAATIQINKNPNKESNWDKYLVILLNIKLPDNLTDNLKYVITFLSLNYYSRIIAGNINPDHDAHTPEWASRNLTRLSITYINDNEPVKNIIRANAYALLAAYYNKQKNEGAAVKNLNLLDGCIEENFGSTVVENILHKAIIIELFNESLQIYSIVNAPMTAKIAKLLKLLEDFCNTNDAPLNNFLDKHKQFRLEFIRLKLCINAIENGVSNKEQLITTEYLASLEEQLSQAKRIKISDYESGGFEAMVTTIRYIHNNKKFDQVIIKHCESALRSLLPSLDNATTQNEDLDIIIRLILMLRDNASKNGNELGVTAQVKKIFASQKLKDRLKIIYPNQYHYMQELINLSQPPGRRMKNRR